MSSDVPWCGVSTTEARPEPVSCGNGATPDGPVLELLPGRRVPLSPRESGPQTEVTRLLPQRHLRTVGAWCFVDHYGPDDVSGGDGMQVAPHPHTGLQTVSWLLDGAIRHRDTLGSDVLLRPGALGLMTAGRGIAHSERSPSDRPRLLHGVQLWVALPEGDRDGDPAFALHDDDLATLPLEGGSVRVFVGSLGGASSPAGTRTPLLGAEVRLDPAASVSLPLPAAHEHALVVVEGTVDRRRGRGGAWRPGLPRHRSRDPRAVVRRRRGGAAARRRAVRGGARHVVELPRAQPGRDRGLPSGLERRRRHRRPTGPFGRVEGADTDRMLAPPLPGVALRPRGRTG